MKWYNETKYVDINTETEIKPEEKIFYTSIKMEKKTTIDNELQIGRITFTYYCIKKQLTLDIL